MARRLSPATSLDTLRREAKRWLKRLRSNDPDARARLARALPQIPAAPRIRDVQLALAREHGCAGWIALKAAVDRNIRQVQPGMDLIRPDELASVEPYGPWRSRGRDVNRWPDTGGGQDREKQDGGTRARRHVVPAVRRRP